MKYIGKYIQHVKGPGLRATFAAIGPKSSKDNAPDSLFSPCVVNSEL